MKKVILSIVTVHVFQLVFGQLKIESGANWITTGNASVVVQDLGVITNGTLGAGTGSFKFTGTQTTGITGSNLPSFYIIEITKTNNAKVQLARDINVNSSINFISGLLDLWSSKIVLATGAYIAGETETNRVMSTGAGFIEITQNLNSPNGANPGNLGAFITTSENLGAVIVRRGHNTQSGNGLTTSINRYYSISPANNTNLDATLRLKYFDAELNGQSENSLVIYQGFGAGATWNNLSRTSNSTNANYVEKTGIANLALQTLATDNSVAGAVTGLTFTGQRKKPSEVQLNWTSQTETNMSGYQVQCRLDNEIDFTDRAFVNTLAPNGNSNSSLSYQHTDANSYNGISYYRLKIIDQSNTISYSNIISVAGKSKGKGTNNNNNNLTTSESEELTTKPMNSFTTHGAKKISVGPNPNNGHFWFTVNGIEKETVATLYTIDGRQVNQFRLSDGQRQQVNGLKSGIYLLKVPGFDAKKIIVNGAGKATPVFQQQVPDKSKL